MSTEAELRADLDRSTRALERAAETARKAETTIAELQAELVLAEQKMTTWMEASVARTAERDAAVENLVEVRKQLAEVGDDLMKTKIILSGGNDEIAALKKRLDAAAGVELDALTGVLEAHLKMWRASGVAADRKAGAVEALGDVLNMVRRRRAGE